MGEWSEANAYLTELYKEFFLLKQMCSFFSPQHHHCHQWVHWHLGAREKPKTTGHLRFSGSALILRVTIIFHPATWFWKPLFLVCSVRMSTLERTHLQSSPVNGLEMKGGLQTPLKTNCVLIFISPRNGTWEILLFLKRYSVRPICAMVFKTLIYFFFLQPCCSTTI